MISESAAENSGKNHASRTITRKSREEEDEEEEVEEYLVVPPVDTNPRCAMAVRTSKVRARDS